MSQSSSRHLIKQAVKLTQLLLLFDSDSDSNLKSDWLQLNCILERRYLVPRRQTLHQPLYERQQLHLLPDSSFCQLFRTTSTAFFKLLEIIENHNVFQNSSTNPQRDPAVQLAVALCRLGSYGNGAALHRLENLFSIGHGTVDSYTKRVITAILGTRRSVLCWPTKEERIEISQVMETEGFPGCIGFIDGTTIPLSQKPKIDGNHYFDRKKRYSVAVQLVCDHNKKFISLHVGLPGSCHDSYVFNRMQIAQEPHKYFDQDQYLLADSAYGSGKYVVPAYRNTSLNDQEKTDFNYHLAQSRVQIEHAIGILKGRWASLREMQSQLQNSTDMQVLINWVVCCVILHNLLANIKDEWSEMFEDDIPDPPQNIPVSSFAASDAMRERVLPITLASVE